MNYLSINSYSLRVAGRSLLKDITIELDGPSIVAIIGHNGSGKTSFLKTIIGRAPFQGSFSFGPKGIGLECLLERGKIAYLPQENHFAFSMSVLDVVMMGGYNPNIFAKDSSTSDKESALKAIEQVGLLSKINQDVLTLSGGEQQLVMLAQLLVQESEIYLLDEPLQSLDVRNKKIVSSVIKRLGEVGKTIFFTTHDLFYLEHLEGVLLNFSRENPCLESITIERIKKEHLFLESDNGF